MYWNNLCFPGPAAWKLLTPILWLSARELPETCITIGPAQRVGAISKSEAGSKLLWLLELRGSSPTGGLITRGFRAWLSLLVCRARDIFEANSACCRAVDQEAFTKPLPGDHPH